MGSDGCKCEKVEKRQGQAAVSGAAQWNTGGRQALTEVSTKVT
jgi:hypothetical protein